MPVDFSQGLDVNNFTEHQAKRFSELEWSPQQEGGTTYLRTAFDKLNQAGGVRNAQELILKYEIGAKLFCYMLYNWIDHPRDFFERLLITQEIVDDLGGIIYLFPQRYEPFMGLKRNSYIGKHWTLEFVRGIVRQTTHLRGFIGITKQHTTLEKWYGNTYEEFIDRMNEIGKKGGVVRPIL